MKAINTNDTAVTRLYWNSLGTGKPMTRPQFVSIALDILSIEDEQEQEALDYMREFERIWEDDMANQYDDINQAVLASGCTDNIYGGSL